MIIDNGLFVELSPRRVRRGSLRIDPRSGEIVEFLPPGPSVDRNRDPEVLDAGGAVVLPGLVCAHTHLYSSLARGMPPPAAAPADFRQILERVWWRLDRALDDETVEVSALVGAVEALRCGVTTLFDHHASPAALEGSLDRVGGAVRTVGIRGVLCYEVSDRGGLPEARRGIAENERFLKAVAAGHPLGPLLRGLVGAHAAFTLSQETAERLAALCAERRAAVHIHLAEDRVDQSRDGVGTAAWLERCGLLRSGAGEGGEVPPLLAHGVHLSDAEAARLCELGAVVVHNPRSNLNNAVGYARPWRIGRLCLGTDGIGADMLAEAQVAFFLQQTERRRAAEPGSFDVLDVLAANQTLAGRLFGRRLGRLQPGAPADLVVTDYLPPTPLLEDGGNLAGHLLFGLSSRHVRHVLCNGRLLLRDRQLPHLDEAALAARAQQLARRLWQRL